MKIFNISGYWLEEPHEIFTDLLVAEYDDTPEGFNDNDIFFYGMSEKDIIDNINDEELDLINHFVITEYSIYKS